jgi:uncharacterized protein YcfJ
MGWMVVMTVGAVRARSERKRSVCARARAEARVPIRSVRAVGGGSIGACVDGGGRLDMM